MQGHIFTRVTEEVRGGGWGEGEGEERGEMIESTSQGRRDNVKKLFMKWL